MELDVKWSSHVNCCVLNITYRMFLIIHGIFQQSNYYSVTYSYTVFLGGGGIGFCFSFVCLFSFTNRCAPFLKFRYHQAIVLLMFASPEQHTYIALHCGCCTHRTRKQSQHVTVLYLLE